MARPQFRRQQNQHQGPAHPAPPPRVFNPVISFKNLELLARGQTRENRYERERAYENTFRQVSADGLQDILLLAWHQHSQAGTTPSAQEFAAQLNQRQYFTKLVARATDLEIDFDDVLAQLETKLKEPEQLKETFQRLKIPGWEPNILPLPDPNVPTETITIEADVLTNAASATANPLSADPEAPAPTDPTEAGPPITQPAGPAPIQSEKKRPQAEFQIAKKAPDTKEKRLYLWHEGKLLATWEATPEDIPKSNRRITEPELRKLVTPEILRTKNALGVILSDRIATHQQLTGGTLVQIDPDAPTDLSVTNVYPGVPEDQVLTLRDLILFNSQGQGTDRIHQRRDVIEALQKNSLELNTENAVTLCRAFNRGAADYSLKDCSSVDFRELTDDEVIDALQAKAKNGTIDQSELDARLTALKDIEADKAPDDAARNQINHQITLKREELRRFNSAPMDMRIALEVLRNTSPVNIETGKGWTSTEMTLFAKEALRQSETAEEQLTYLREYAAWMNNYKDFNPWAEYEVNASLEQFNVALEAHGIGLLDLHGNGKYTALTTIGRTREDILNMATDRIAASALLNSVVGNLGTNPVAEAAKANQQHGKALNQKSPTTRETDISKIERLRFNLVTALTKGPIKDHTDKFLDLEAPEAPKLKASLYRQFGKHLNEEEKISIAKAATKEDGELLLAMAEDPLTRGELRRYLINSAPAGTLGAHIQITVLRESLTEGRLTGQTNVQERHQRLHNKNELEAKTLIDLLHMEAGPGRNATVAELARRLAQQDTTPNAPIGRLAWQGFQAKLHTPNGRFEWDKFVADIEQQLTEEQRQAKETQEVRATLLAPPRVVRDEKSPPKLVYSLSLLNGEFEMTAESPAPSNEEFEQAMALHTNEEVTAVICRGGKGEAHRALKVERANKVLMTNKELVGDRTASVWHDIGPAAIDHLNNYLKLAGELKALERIEDKVKERATALRPGIAHPPTANQSKAEYEAELNRLSESQATQAVIDELGGAKDETGRRIGKKAGSIEFALPENPNNPLPGSPEEQRATKERLRKEWNDTHAEILHGLRRSDKSFVVDDTGKVVKPGDIHTILEGLRNNQLPGQLFEGTDRIKGVDVTEQITTGELNAQVTLATYHGKLRGHREKWDDLDKEIAAAHGGELPSDPAAYLRARKQAALGAMTQHLGAVQAHIRESDLRKNIDRSAISEAAGGQKKFVDLIFGGKGRGEPSLDSLGAALLR